MQNSLFRNANFPRLEQVSITKMDPCTFEWWVPAVVVLNLMRLSRKASKNCVLACLGVGCRILKHVFGCLVWVETELERNVAFILFFGKRRITLNLNHDFAKVSKTCRRFSQRSGSPSGWIIICRKWSRSLVLNDELDQQGFGIGLFRWLGWV